MTGDIGSNYESDFFNLYPNNLLSASYYAVVPGFSTSNNGGAAVATAVYLYNPNSSAVTVYENNTSTCGTSNPPPTACQYSVPAKGGVRVLMPTTATASGSGANFYSSNGTTTFAAYSIVDSGNQAYDWGYTLVPQNQLTQQVKVGWVPGATRWIIPTTPPRTAARCGSLPSPPTIPVPFMSASTTMAMMPVQTQIPMDTTTIPC